METRANHLIIGIFVLGVLGLILGFIYWINNDAAGPSGKNYYVIFDGSAQGLSEASPVLFNGIRFGAVRSVGLVPEDTRKVRALITVRQDTPVRANSRARISQQGLAGYIALEITPGAPDAPMLEAKPGETYPVIHADLAGGGMLAGVSDAAGAANELLRHLDNLVLENQDSLHHTIKNIESFTATISERNEDIAAAIRDTRALAARFNDISMKIETAVDRIAGEKPDDPKSAVAQLQQAANSFRQLADKLDHTLGDKAGGLTDQAQRSLREFELFMKDGRRLADSLDRVVGKVERNPAGFLVGGQQTPKY